MKKRSIVIWLALLLVLLLGGYYYLVFPSINIHETIFWMTLGVVFVFSAVVSVLISSRGKRELRSLSAVPLVSKLLLGVGLLFFAVLLVGGLAGSPVFRARSYASLLQVENRDFAKDMEESERVTDIALMDTESARIFGNRKIGSLADVVSQFEVETDYNQINISGKPVKVASLRYASFFKWWNNRKNGIPGYVQVDPVNSEAKYISLAQGMKYTPSGYFNENLLRHVQLHYPTKIIRGYYFEIDDAGNPCYICPTMTARIGLFGGMDVNGAILCDPVDGSCQYYPVKDIPAWVDRVYDGELLTQKYNWMGTLSDGFWNSIIGQSGCRETTDDYGYKTIGDDVWIYTGVTSVTGDQSNIGFVLMNQRTSEAVYYSVSGAEEHSAMAAAQGEVQEKGYRASFPSLINVAGVPTYIMVLKDNGGLVKMYAMVNVEQYNLVATATSQSQVFSDYKKLLAANPGDTPAELEEKTADIVVEEIRFIPGEDGTVVYIMDQEHNVYKQPFVDNESLVRIATGDAIRVTYEEMEDGIHYLIGYTFR